MMQARRGSPPLALMPASKGATSWQSVSRQPNIEVVENHFGIDLITSQKLGYVGENRCLGAYVLDKNGGRVYAFVAPVTLLATGGCGKVYLYTTNPGIATGDGVAMSWRAGAKAW